MNTLHSLPLHSSYNCSFPISPLSPFQNHFYIYMHLFFLFSNRFYLYYVSISISALSLTPLDSCMLSLLFFPLSLCQQTKPPDSQVNSTSLKLLFSKTLLIWLWMGWRPWPSPSACVYGIRYAWNTFDLTEGFSHVLPTVTTVCGFKQILWVCVCLSVCVYTVLYVCVARRCMTDLKYSIICSGMSKPRDGEERGGWETEMKG